MKKPLYKETELLLKYWNNQLSGSERIEFEIWLNQSSSRKALLERLKNEGILKMDTPLTEADQAGLWDKILRMEPSIASAIEQGKVRRIWPRLSAAAAIVILMVGAYYFLQTNKRQPVTEKQPQKTVISDKEPGRDGAILKLANGHEIVLDNAANGNLAQQGSAAISKDGNSLSYNSRGKKRADVLYNTLRTPVGRQFKIILPDGTKAWLNSYSSITYPTSFAGSERNVTVSGEVYMEVAKDPSKPFKAHVVSPVNGMGETIVEVLGTHFNINSYGDETPVKTTLLEGEVKVAEGNVVALLKPGQQAEIEAHSINVKSGVDINKETAWKNNLFSFKNDKVKNVMPQIARWYDVDVVYEGSNVQNIGITGKIERSANLSEVLKLLTFINVHYRLEGRRLILTDK